MNILDCKDYLALKVRINMYDLGIYSENAIMEELSGDDFSTIEYLSRQAGRKFNQQEQNHILKLKKEYMIFLQVRNRLKMINIDTYQHYKSKIHDFLDQMGMGYFIY